MKKITFLVSVLFLVSACGITKKIVQIDEPVTKVYTDLTDNQDDLFVKANDWMISVFNDASSVIQFSDKDKGTLIGKYLMSGEKKTSSFGYTSTSVDTRVYAKIDVRVKDNRARISIEPMDSWEYDESGVTIYDYSEKDFYKDMDRLTADFEKAIKADKIDF